MARSKAGVQLILRRRFRQIVRVPTGPTLAAVRSYYSGTVQWPASGRSNGLLAGSLLYLNAARRLDNLRVPPGKRAGTFSIRINDRWRLCLAWKDGEPHDVEIVDYH